MSLREKMGENKRLTLIGAVVVIVAAIVMIWYQSRGDQTDTLAAENSPRTFFTTDDGKTWFTDSSKHVPPFDHNGKLAVRAYVFSTDGGKTPFVGYLERYAPAAKKQMEKSIDAGGVSILPPPSVIGGIEVKKSGAQEWVKMIDRERASQVCSVRTANGVATRIEP